MGLSRRSRGGLFSALMALLVAEPTLAQTPPVTLAPPPASAPRTRVLTGEAAFQVALPLFSSAATGPGCCACSTPCRPPAAPTSTCS